MKRALPVAIAGTFVAAAFILVLLGRASSQGIVEGEPFVRSLEGSTSPVDIVLSWGDGQAFDAIARDPTLSDPRVFSQGAPELAYRAQRPFAAYLAWVFALGRPGWTGAALLVIVCLGAGLAAGAAALLVDRGGVERWAGLAILLLPGSLASLNGIEPETLAFGLAAIGLWRWRAGGGIAECALWFALATLTRESLILVPAALAVYETATTRRWQAGALPAIAAAVWLGWIAVVRARTGAWPFDAGQGRLGRPGRGLSLAVTTWGAGQVLVLTIGAVLLVVALLSAPRAREAWIAVAHVFPAALFGSQVWNAWEDFSRPLLPMYAAAFLAIVGAAARRSPDDGRGPMRRDGVGREPRSAPRP